jgi:hypothetical protein
MKKARNLSMAIIVFLFAGMNMQLRAQMEFESGQMAINAGISYGFDIEELGLRGGLTYFLSPDMRIGGDLNYWLVESPSGGSSTFLEINANFNYIFYNENNMILYGIGSLGIHYSRVKFTFFGETISDSDSELGLGIGGGFEYNLGPVSVFAEPKLFLTGFDQLKLNIGVRYYL